MKIYVCSAVVRYYENQLSSYTTHLRKICLFYFYFMQLMRKKKPHI